MQVIGGIHSSLVFKRRTRVLAAHLTALLPRDADVLDVGCGDGTLDVLMLQARPDISIRGIDVFVRPKTNIPVEPFDGKVIPYADKSFSIITFVDVLHHTEDPLALLAEAARVARDGIVIKDHAREGIFAEQTLRFMDWVGNAHHGVVLPYNYWSQAQWDDALKALDLRAEAWISRVGLYPWPASQLFDRQLHFVAKLVRR